MSPPVRMLIVHQGTNHVAKNEPPSHVDPASRTSQNAAAFNFSSGSGGNGLETPAILSLLNFFFFPSRKSQRVKSLKIVP